jgi:hypothetical protein
MNLSFKFFIFWNFYEDDEGWMKMVMKMKNKGRTKSKLKLVAGGLSLNLMTFMIQWYIFWQKDHMLKTKHINEVYGTPHTVLLHLRHL